MPINTKQVEFPIKPIEELLPVIVGAKTFVIADTETTGFGNYDDIIEIGAVKLDAEAGKITGKFSSFCRMKNHKKVPPKITELTAIRTEDLSNAPNIETVLAGFKGFLGQAPLVCHNAVFDWRMLNTKYKLLGVKLSNEAICTMRLFKFLHPDLPTNLEYITGYYGTPIEGHHRAYVDCKWTAAAFMKMRREVIDKNLCPTDVQTMFSDNNARHQLTADDLVRQCLIHRISGWKKGKLRRIYCTTSVADFFYDLNDHVWTVARNKTQYDLVPDLLAKFILDRLDIDLASFQAMYAPS